MTIPMADLPAKPANPAEVEAFLRKLAAVPPPAKGAGQGGRLLFALDATASREATWDHAARLQAEMFEAASGLGGLQVQLAYYRGFGEFEASEWTTDAKALLRRMTGVFCLAGETQIAKVLKHAIAETRKRKVDALVFVGDCAEEDIDHLGKLAGELGVLGVPAFMFHEGDDPIAVFAFGQIARLTGGACCRFDAGSARALRELLRAVAVYAAGGRAALEAYGRKQGGEVLRLVDQMNTPGGRGR